jgi:hypothetical protein
MTWNPRKKHPSFPHGAHNQRQAEHRPAGLPGVKGPLYLTCPSRTVHPLHCGLHLTFRQSHPHTLGHQTALCSALRCACTTPSAKPLRQSTHYLVARPAATTTTYPSCYRSCTSTPFPSSRHSYHLRSSKSPPERQGRHAAYLRLVPLFAQSICHSVLASPYPTIDLYLSLTCVPASRSLLYFSAAPTSTTITQNTHRLLLLHEKHDPSPATCTSPALLTSLPQLYTQARAHTHTHTHTYLPTQDDLFMRPNDT